MDLRQMIYIQKIAEEKNITKAAEKLYITRSALNYSLLNTEKELGFPIFKRLTSSLVPTHEGQIYLNYVEKILADCHEMQHTMLAYRDTANQQIAIGITVNGGQRTFEHVFPDFHRKYPNVTIHLLEANTRVLENALLSGEIDLAFFGDIPKQPDLDCVRVIPDSEMMLTIAVDHPLLERLGLRDKAREAVDLQLFRDEPFILMNRLSYMHQKALNCFLEAGYMPKVMMECASISTPLRFAEEGIGLTFMPGDVIRQHPLLTGFRIRPFISASQTIFFRKGSQFSEPEKELMEMLKLRYAEVLR
ncbi:MAG: LysR family transcriptional regulator [Lachnospiraceae bacterium]|nr:LysR family transcriptional regulator [Lachnospiraceae bacterium]